MCFLKGDSQVPEFFGYCRTALRLVKSSYAVPLWIRNWLPFDAAPAWYEFPTFLVVHNQAIQRKVLTVGLTLFAIPCFGLLAGFPMSYNEWRRKESDLYPTTTVGFYRGAKLC
jgi:hypothetical protein